MPLQFHNWKLGFLGFGLCLSRQSAAADEVGCLEFCFRFLSLIFGFLRCWYLGNCCGAALLLRAMSIRMPQPIVFSWWCQTYRTQTAIREEGGGASVGSFVRRAFSCSSSGASRHRCTAGEIRAARADGYIGDSGQRRLSRFRI